MAGMSYAPAFVAGSSGVREDQHGLASGLLSTAQELGAAIGLAALSTAAVVMTGSAATVAGYRAGFAAAAATTVVTLAIAARTPRGLGVEPPVPSAPSTSEPTLSGASR